MAKVSEWLDPGPKLGGLNKKQEREVADQLERSLGLNPEWGWKRNIANILGNAYSVYGMTDEEWGKKFRELPYYGDWQGQDVDAVQEHLLNKYPHKTILGLLGLGEKYGGVIPSDAAYQKIMSISPDALSRVKATGLDSYEGPIAETIEWEEDVPKMAKGGLLSGAAIVGEAGPELVVGNAEVIPLPTKEEKAFWANHPDPKFHSAQFTLQLERMTDQEKIDAGLMEDPAFQRRIDEVQERAEKERRDKKSKQKLDVERRVRQYDAIAKRLWT
jgi:hypothetical protein